VYLNARYYDPEIARFTAPDPIVRPGQKLNRFSYALNNPTNLLDPTGLDDESPYEFPNPPPPPGSFANCSQSNLSGCPGPVVTVNGLYGTVTYHGGGYTQQLMSMQYGSDEGEDRARERKELDDLYDSYAPTGKRATIDSSDDTEANVTNATDGTGINGTGSGPSPGDGGDNDDSPGCPLFGCGSEVALVQSVDYELQIHSEGAMYAAGTGVVLGTGVGAAAGAAGGFGALLHSGIGLAVRGYQSGAALAARGYNIGTSIASGVRSGISIAYRGYSTMRASGTAERFGEFTGQFGYGFAQGMMFRGGSPMPVAMNPTVRLGQLAGQAVRLLPMAVN